MNQNRQKSPLQQRRRRSSSPTTKSGAPKMAVPHDSTPDRAAVSRELRRGEAAEVGGRLRREPSVPRAPQMADPDADRVVRALQPWGRQTVDVREGGASE